MGGGHGAGRGARVTTVPRTVSLPDGSPLRELERPTLVVLLRSFGCTFCREALADVAKLKQRIRDAGADIVFVHSEPHAEAAPWFSKYGLDDVLHIADPSLAHYRAFGLGRTHATSMVNPGVWTRGAISALAHGFGAQTAEMMRRQPGVFVLKGDRILAEHRHKTPADRPDYLALVDAGRADHVGG
ncbi:MAG TPA: SelL-related redox protein [Vicinamibacterales bacterium]|nr:SelL-related redox protein [Vicinamibacterales bacterium]